MNGFHTECNISGCKYYYAYIRFKKKWIKIGLFLSGCKTFKKFDDIKLEDNKPENPYIGPNDNFLKTIARDEFDFSKRF